MRSSPKHTPEGARQFESHVKWAKSFTSPNPWMEEYRMERLKATQVVFENFAKQLREDVGLESN